MYPRNTPFTVEPLSPLIGAAIGGIDLSEPLTDEARRALQDALDDRLVLLFSDQMLTPEAHRAFAANFGPLYEDRDRPGASLFPEMLVLDTEPRARSAKNSWLAAATYAPVPPLGAALYASTLPAKGGEMLWLSTIAAYDALSPRFKKFLNGLSATHDFEKSFPAAGASTLKPVLRPDERKKYPPVLHPVVRTHPSTGKKALFVNSGFTTRINELSPTESDALLGYLFHHVTKPEFQLRHCWRENDLALWDNRVTQHRATVNYGPARRIMQRTTIIGERPH
jgi:taurine dioxygenase